MADIIELHPSVRERRKPRVTAASLAEYLIFKPDQQETVLHDSRFSTVSIVAAHGDAMRALRSYNTDPLRSQSTLDNVKDALTRKAAIAGLKPKTKEEALRCLETIELFERAENALGLRNMPLVEAPRFPELMIEEVALSVQLDFLVRPMAPKGTGGIIMRPQKAPDPAACRLPETKVRRGEQRREMARYMVAMIEMLLSEYPDQYGPVERDLCFVADIRLGERIGAGTDYAARVRSIKAACKQIAQLWNGLQPRKSVRKKDTG